MADDVVLTTNHMSIGTDESQGPDTVLFITLRNTIGEETRLVFEQDFAEGFAERLTALLAAIRSRPRPN